MREFASLTRRGQIGRLRGLGTVALRHYGVADARLSFLGYAENATFRVDSGASRYLLRLNRPRVHAAGTVASELAWLAALRRDTDVHVPEPVPAQDGLLVVEAQVPGVPDPHLCVCLHWLDGRFVGTGLAPTQLARVGALLATLHGHTESWKPPSGFARPRVGVLADAARAKPVRSAAEALPGEHPSAEDGDRLLELVESLMSSADVATVIRALELVRATTAELTARDSFGLIHADLHHENFLFRSSEVAAIDFDDCGWGFHLYDLAVTLSELRRRQRYPELEDAFLGAYAAERTLVENHSTHLSRLFVLRRLQILAWVLESRERGAFRDNWRAYAREDLDWLAAEVGALER